MAVGKFIANNLLNKKLGLFIALDYEWLHYADGDAQSYSILIATPVSYDEDSGVLVCSNEKKQRFYINEESIGLFWEYDSGFNVRENTTSTIKPVKKSRDII